jgi:hypothetical protein
MCACDNLLDGRGYEGLQLRIRPAFPLQPPSPYDEHIKTALADSPLAAGEAGVQGVSARRPRWPVPAR